jgi:hypothetical protein
LLLQPRGVRDVWGCRLACRGLPSQCAIGGPSPTGAGAAAISVRRALSAPT